MDISRLILVMMALFGCATTTVDAALAAPVQADDAARIGASGLPVPRFGSLGPSRVFMRAGPDKSYPVIWIYIRPETPVEVVQEYGPWRKVRDIDGAEGWINGNLLTDRRTGIVRGGVRPLYAAPRPNAPKVWRAEAGVVGRLIVCEEGWCQMSVDGKTGWILRDQIWGAYAGENFN